MLIKIKKYTIILCPKTMKFPRNCGNLKEVKTNAVIKQGGLKDV